MLGGMGIKSYIESLNTKIKRAVFKKLNPRDGLF